MTGLQPERMNLHTSILFFNFFQVSVFELFFDDFLSQSFLKKKEYDLNYYYYYYYYYYFNRISAMSMSSIKLYILLVVLNAI